MFEQDWISEETWRRLNGETPIVNRVFSQEVEDRIQALVTDYLYTSELYQKMLQSRTQIAIRQPKTVGDVRPQLP